MINSPLDSIWVFVSYAHEDRSIAAELCRELKGIGVETWRDESHLLPGGSMPIGISNALDRSVAFVVLLSRHIQESGWIELELNAALGIRAETPSYPVIPLRIDDSRVPALLKGLHYLSLQQSSVSEAASRIKSAVHEAVSRPRDSSWHDLVLRELAGDQFEGDRASTSYGGWGKSYAEYLRIAFLRGPPQSVAGVDSISVTHWAIRGLLSLRRQLLATQYDQAANSRLASSLSAARTYLHRHFDGIGAGLYHPTTSGEQISRDPRHSATFIKALLALKGGDVSHIRRAADYALNRFIDDGDGRLSSGAEIYYLARLVEAQSHLRPPTVSADTISDVCDSIERLFSASFFEAHTNAGSATLFSESSQPHMALYYTWWVLDACGELLVQFGNAATREVINRILTTLPSLGEITQNGLGFPLTLGGSADVGMSAQIGDILLRLAPVQHAASADLIFKFVTARLNAVSLEAYPVKFLLWAVPVFFERHKTTKRLKSAQLSG